MKSFAESSILGSEVPLKVTVTKTVVFFSRSTCKKRERLVFNAQPTHSSWLISNKTSSTVTRVASATTDMMTEEKAKSSVNICAVSAHPTEQISKAAVREAGREAKGELDGLSLELDGESLGLSELSEGESDGLSLELDGESLGLSEGKSD